MKSESEFKAYWEGALVWSDDELTDEQKTARCRAWFGLEFSCRHAVRSECGLIHCIFHDCVCVQELCVCEMRDCSGYSQMPCNLLEIIKAQSLLQEATITQKDKESCALKATETLEGIGKCDHEDG